MPSSARGTTSNLGLKAAFLGQTLFLGITVSDDLHQPGDQLDITLFFPEAGTTARGAVFRYRDDRLLAPPEIGPPPFALPLVKWGAKPTQSGFTLEMGIPARALPRFQAFGPLAVSICLDYSDVDSAAAEPSKATSCATGEMLGGPTRLPDELRKSLKLTPSGEVEGIEAREHGWLGYSRLHYPTWALADEALTPQSLAELVAGDEAIAPASVALPTPSLVLGDGRPLFAVLTGKNPYLKDSCVSERELRMTLYLASGRTATRVLEWPAANCKLGRAMRVELAPGGSLEIGYTGGATHRYVWTADHFERAELGLLKRNRSLTGRTSSEPQG